MRQPETIAELSQNVNHGRPLATAGNNQKLSQTFNNCEQPATTDENQKLSQHAAQWCPT